jgi:hypothetical protein
MYGLSHANTAYRKRHECCYTHTHTHYNCRRSFSLTYVPIHLALFLSLLVSLSYLSLQEFGENAPDRPHVDGFGVLLAAKHDLGGPVPPRHDVLRQFEVVVVDAAGEAEIADLNRC